MFCKFSEYYIKGLTFMTEAHVIMDCNVISAINIVDLLP